MGVIGRLDDQVNEVIIKPVGARTRQDGEETRPASKESVSQHEAPTEKSPAQDEEDAKQPRAQSELPVWLL